MGEPGQKLKKIRERLRLRFRDVEEASGRIATLHANDEFIVALSRLADIENKGTMPSAYRLYSLCAIYRLEMSEVLGWYGVSMSTLPADAAVLQHTQTHMINFHAEEGGIQVPISLDPGIDLAHTTFLSRFIQRWGTLPLMLFNNIDLRNFRYGLIGTEDSSMYPIIPPGSLVVIDDTKRKIVNSGWNSEFERPIYFLEHRDGYLCGWCTLREGVIIVQSHPASLCDPRTFRYPDEIEVIGQVMHVAMTLDHALRRRNAAGA
jgi:transcriptional regulator with XRE-family HTH domain